MNEQEYTLNCDKCGIPYKSKEGFPSPQLCPACSEQGELLLTEQELADIDEKAMKECWVKPCKNSPGKHPFIDSAKYVELSNKARLEAQLAKVKQHYEQKIRELFKDVEKYLDSIHVGFRGETYRTLKDKYLRGKK